MYGRTNNNAAGPRGGAFPTRGGGNPQQKAGGGGGDPNAAKYPQYLADKEALSKFLTEFRTAGNAAVPEEEEEERAVQRTPYKYMNMMQLVANRQSKIFRFELEDLVSFGMEDLAEKITMNVNGYSEEICNVVDAQLPHVEHLLEDSIDYIDAESRAVGSPLPSALTRRYELVLMPMNGPKGKPLSLRALRASMIGTLTVIHGVCISATAARPKLQILTSVCEVCAEATFQFVSGDRITPQLVCNSTRCKTRNSVGRLLPQYKASRFTKFQELRVQELPVDVPKGAIPRTIRVICEGEQTRIAEPGQTVRIVGYYAPDPGTGAGNEAFRASTMFRTQFNSIHVSLEKRSYGEAASDMAAALEEARRHPDREALLEKLVHSIAPEIWGMEDVKKALLCLLIGGSNVANGAAIRSDINILMMGDPGVAKSQLLKWIASVAPRSVFTTGKGSSGVGLTAAVSRDPHTGETVLEGGALVLSDHGVCCIDEFDKMDETDRTSLHEVMEQQTVSIAKAGIITTLNARTSILAASNPKFGRWKRNFSPSENVNLPPALLSRFDLLWLLLDEPDRNRDVELSMHVTFVHLHGAPPGKTDFSSTEGELHSDYFSREFLRAYVGEAKRICAYIDSNASKIITEIYCEMRAQRVRQSSVVTARTLLSLIRLCQALARLRLSERVQEQDVREAGRLLDASRASLQERGTEKGVKNVGATDAAIYTHMKDLAKGEASISLQDVRSTLLIRGISEEQLERCIQTYRELGVLATDAANTYIEFAN